MYRLALKILTKMVFFLKTMIIPSMSLRIRAQPALIISGLGGSRRVPSVSGEDFRMAVIRGSVEAVTDALDKGVAVDMEFSSGWTALMYAGNCARNDVFKVLLERGADPSYHKDLFTVLMATCGASLANTDAVLECVQLLIGKGVDVNAHDRHHMTALMCAAREGRLEIVRLLLDNGAEIDRQDFRGWTALSWATHREKLGVVKLLLERGADKNKKHTDGLTAIDLARGKEESVWLFEGKAGAAGGEQGAGDADVITAAAAAAAAAKADVSKGSAELKYGDLEMFLFGLQLGQFYSLFLTHQVDFPLLLTMTEGDLIKMGISQVGVRLKLMEGIAAVHKRNWETSSLVPIRTKCQVKCPDAIAMVANLSTHLRFITSSVTYIKDNVTRYPQFMALSQESADPKQLLLHTGDAKRNVDQLQKELCLLHSILSKELATGTYTIPDQLPATARRRKVRLGRLVLIGVSASTVAFLVWRRDRVADSATSFISGVRLFWSGFSLASKLGFV
ncbi:ankyrin repeat, SAM and basic leucine zipper domain-containing protein 1-like isoform X2 [Babylonia areolata]|uniref:ankyrin repeat, SAM and basic leucine zipper domain-containing protein 1-like isoform X2 n=1 Tax=Babylonia areolata TaxID=304850 RepID=UPI003FD2A56C